MKEDKTFELVSQMIDKVFCNYYKKEKKMQNEEELEEGDRSIFADLLPDEKTRKASFAPMKQPTTFYESIEDYTTVTGKRFRMTKEQKQRGLTREQAFTETFGGNN